MAKQDVMLQDLFKIGCKSQQAAALAHQIYMDLSEVQVLRDVSYFYNQELDLVYLTGKKSRSVNTEFYLPLSSSTDISPARIRLIQDTLCQDLEKEEIILAIKESDSSAVYYKLTRGLVAPNSPETAKRKKYEEDRHNCLEAELRKRSKSLLAEVQQEAGDNKMDTGN